MDFYPGRCFHVYNQGNNRQQIFMRPENYQYFLRLTIKYILPCGELHAFCLMPNHFHLLLRTHAISCEKIRVGGLELPRLLNGVRLLQTTYAQAINKQEQRTGSLFRQKAKFLEIVPERDAHGAHIIHYLHNNPVKAGLVTEATDWPYSSAREYAGLPCEPLCSRP